jgi:ABC-type dipeptide/oligopeptide/nickel transport system permease component
MEMWVYVLRRALLVIPVVVGVMTILFLMINTLSVPSRIESFYPPSHGAVQPWVPTEPCPGNATQQCPNPLYQKAIQQLGLNKPVPEQWALYMYNSLTFRWGYTNNASSVVNLYPSLRDEPVTSVLAWFLPYTIELAGLALIFTIAISLPLGRLSAVYRNRPVDHASRLMSFSGYALPTFLLGSLALYSAVVLVSPNGHSPICPGQAALNDFWGSWPPAHCSVLLGANLNSFGYPNWLVNGFQSTPTGFPTVDAAYHGLWLLSLDTLLRMVIPALVIAYGTIAILLRYVRNSMLEVMNLDFVRTARANGLSERVVVRRHMGRNSLNVTVTVMGLTFATFIGGFPVIEDVFNLWGVGRILALSLQETNGGYDFGLIFGSTLLFTFIIVAANIIVDVLYAYLDPRVRLQ